MRRPDALLTALLLALTSAACAGPSDADTDFPTQLRDRLMTESEEVITGEDGWLFFAPELRSVTAPRFWGPEATAPELDPLAAIVDFRDQLATVGVELLVVPVPTKVAVYPEKLIPGTDPTPRRDGLHGDFLAALDAAGVATIDLLPLWLEARRAPEEAAAPLYCRQDTHWSGRACRLAAERIAQKLTEMGAVPESPAAASSLSPWAAETREVEIRGDLWRRLAETRPVPERLPLTFVGTRRDGLLVPVAPDRTSPVLLLGDSHALVFHAGGDLHARGAGLADHLGAELGRAIDVVAVRGSGATASRVNLRRRGDGLQGKKAVVWVFAARELTEGRWQRVPVVTTPAASR